MSDSRIPSRARAALCVAALLALSSVGALSAATLDGESSGEPTAYGFTGLLAVRGDAVIAEENADRLFVPASVQKLVVAAAGLHYLGPELTVKTSVYGSLNDLGESGDLVLVGAGDPTWNANHFEKDPRAPLRGLALRLRSSGLTRILGDLVVDGSAFPGRRAPIAVPWNDLSLGYGAAPSALAIDRNTMRVQMAPGEKIGDPVRVVGDPGARWSNRAVTVAADRDGRGTIDFQMIWGTPDVIVRGEFPLSERPFSIEVAAPDPLQRVGEALRAALAEQGIELTGTIRVADRRQSIIGLAELASWTSPPLADWLPEILTESDNWYAEMLLRLIALRVAGEGRLDLGVDVLTRFLVDVIGVAEGSFEIDDGSGLSPANLISPRTVVTVLRFAMGQKWLATFVSSLASAEQGTLSRSWRASPPLAAKTGTLRHSQALAGILDPSADEPTIFAIFLNHRTESRSELKKEILDRLRLWRRTP